MQEFRTAVFHTIPQYRFSFVFLIHTGGFEGISPTGVPRSQGTTPPQESTVGLCLGPYGNPKGVRVFLWARYPCIHSALDPTQPSHAHLMQELKGGVKDPGTGVWEILVSVLVTLPSTLNPTPYTHSTPCTLHPTPYTIHHTPSVVLGTRRPKPCTENPRP